MALPFVRRSACHVNRMGDISLFAICFGRTHRSASTVGCCRFARYCRGRPVCLPFVVRVVFPRFVNVSSPVGARQPCPPCARRERCFDFAQHDKMQNGVFPPPKPADWKNCPSRDSCPWRYKVFKGCSCKNPCFV